jgi:hypothetical protein
MTVGILEVPAVSAPKNLLWLFHEGSPGFERLAHDIIDFRFGVDVVSQGK